MSKQDPYKALAEAKVATQEQSEACEYLVCMPADYPSLFPDSLKGECCECGQEVIFRANAPKTPKRLCIDCYKLLEATEDDEHYITSTTLQETFEAIFGKKQ